MRVLSQPIEASRDCILTVYPRQHYDGNCYFIPPLL
jgi:hypothetical protein